MSALAASWTPDPFATQFERRGDGSLILRPAGRRSRPRRHGSSTHSSIGRARAAIACWSRGATPRRPWREVTYAQMLARVQRIAAGLARRAACPRNGPSLILSGNSIEHLTLALACDVGGHSVLPGVACVLAGGG